MCSKSAKSMEGLRRVLQSLITEKKITEAQRGAALSEYTEILSEREYELMLSDRSWDTLDKFFMNFWM